MEGEIWSQKHSPFENAGAVDGGGKCEIEKTDRRGCDAVTVVDAFMVALSASPKAGRVRRIWPEVHVADPRKDHARLCSCARALSCLLLS